MIYLIDNYDSFSYNLYQLIGSIDQNIRVIRNDEMTVEALEELKPTAIILSPGPGRPEDAGICIDVVKKFANTASILGVCLGHQAICKAFGATVSYAKQMMHGKQSNTILDLNSPLFKGCENETMVARYHSLAVVEDTLPDCLQITAKTVEGEIMAVKHRDYRIYGVQFHPESIMTPEGCKIIRNFLEITKGKE